MGVMNFTEQMNYTGAGYLDKKINTVVNALSDLEKIPWYKRFKGYTAIVFDDGLGMGPSEYWIPGDDAKWVKKNNFGELSIQFNKESASIKLLFGKVEISNMPINDLFDGKFVESVELVKEDDKKTPGNFLKVTYSGEQETKRIDYINLAEAIEAKILIDAKSLEYAEDGKTLGVKTAAPALDKEGNAENAHIEKTDAGLGIAIPITGDDVGTEIE